jgi:hypothetical protein
MAPKLQVKYYTVKLTARLYNVETRPLFEPVKLCVEEAVTPPGQTERRVMKEPAIVD